MILGQAAAVLLAVGWYWRSSPKTQRLQIAKTDESPSHSPGSREMPEKTGPVLVPEIEIEAGRLIVIRVEDSTATVVDLTPDGISYTVDDWFLAFNTVEAFASPVIAMMKE